MPIESRINIFALIAGPVLKAEVNLLSSYVFLGSANRIFSLLLEVNFECSG